MQKRHSFFPLFILTIYAFTFTACSSRDNNPNPPSFSEQESLPAPAPSPSAAEPAKPVTEEALRGAIADLGTAEDTILQRQDCYERLYAMDLFKEEDYLALAQIYGDQGNWEQQRSMLSKVLRLYPSREYAQMLSDIVIRLNGSDGEAAGLAGQITAALEQQDVLALSGLPQDTQWATFFEENLKGIETRVQYTDEDGVLQITTDSLATDITWHRASGELYIYRNDSDGSLLISAVWKDGAYDGPFSTTYFDPSGAELKSAQGILSDGVCVGLLTIRCQGNEYQGTFDDKGTTLEEQLKEVSQRGDVVYAYDSKKKTYLYQQATTVPEFRIDVVFLGLPEYTEWQ